MYLKLYRVRFKARDNNEPVIVYFDTTTRTYFVEGGQPFIKNGKEAKTEQLIGISLNTLEQSFGIEYRSVYRVKVGEKDGKPVFKSLSQCVYKTHTLLSEHMSGEDVEAYAKKKLSSDSLVDELPFSDKPAPTDVSADEPVSASTPYEVAESVADLFGVSSHKTEARPSLMTPNKAEIAEVERLRRRYFNLYDEYDSLLKRAEVDHETEVLNEQIKDLEKRVDKLKQMVLSHKYEGVDFARKGLKDNTRKD